MLKKVLKFLRSMAFGMILLVLILICSLAGSLIAQGNDPAWYVQTYPGWHGTLLMLGLDDVFNSWYFITLLVLLCLNLTLCSLIRIRRVAKAAKHAPEHAAEARTRARLTPAGVEQLQAYLAARRYKKTEFDGAAVYTKNALGWYGSFITHLAILLTVIFGAAALYLPTVTDQTCMPGQALTMEDGTRIGVESFRIENESGQLDYASVVTVTLPDGRVGGPERVSVNYPYSFGGYKIYQQTYGTAGAVRVRNTATGGEDVFTLDSMCFLSLDGVNGIWFEALYPGYIRDEAGNFTLITQTSGAYEDPVYQILLASDGVYTPVMAFPGETVSVAGVDFTFEDPVEYPGLRIKKTPALVNALLCAVFVLMIVGLWFCFFQTPQIITVRQDGYAVGGPKPQGLELELAALLESETEKEDDLC
ncbi:MAG: cytochrome c biogenesis protein ResB [Oscillibacter sp.]|nr:cytochrome c biogenesis protein ResB [Oscillibacter sp.]